MIKHPTKRHISALVSLVFQNLLQEHKIPPKKPAPTPIATFKGPYDIFHAKSPLIGNASPKNKEYPVIATISQKLDAVIINEGIPFETPYPLPI